MPSFPAPHLMLQCSHMSNLNPYQPPSAALAGTQSEQFAKCPKCGAGSASKVFYNWWGGALGPRLFNVVKCGSCRSQYNGRTGAKLTKVIIAYQGLLLLVVVAVWLFIYR
jgi:hypothetical protein